MSAARPLLLLLLLAVAANGQWASCPPEGCCPVVVQPQQQRQPQQSQQQPRYKQRIVPVKPIPQAEAQPEPPTPKPEQPDWKAWEDRLNAIEKRTQEANANLVSQIAAVKPCGCDHAALLARINELEQQLTKSPPPLDYDALAGEILKRLPPQELEWTTLDGQVLRQSTPLGQPLRVQSVRLPGK